MLLPLLALPSQLALFPPVMFSSLQIIHTWLFFIKASKTDPFKVGCTVNIGSTGNLFCPVNALRFYLHTRSPSLAASFFLWRQFPYTSTLIYFFVLDPARYKLKYSFVPYWRCYSLGCSWLFRRINPRHWQMVQRLFQALHSIVTVQAA